ncbi:nucleotide pyrophosphohydrolase [Roseivirga sp.]|uniref:nucleotide pyrophosphohydrolase n=1 Tax=Roseivirga sp. TaxID=1964215 RepID=UPI003B52AC51
MNLDRNKDFELLKEHVIKFREERDWHQFHKIKDLLLGLNIEVSELQELFLWKSDEQLKNLEIDKIEEELADIFIFLIYISEEYGINILKAAEKKIKLNEIKYPISKSKGSNKKYTDLI